MAWVSVPSIATDGMIIRSVHCIAMMRCMTMVRDGHQLKVGTTAPFGRDSVGHRFARQWCNEVASHWGLALRVRPSDLGPLSTSRIRSSVAIELRGCS